MTSDSTASPRKAARRNSWRGLLAAGLVGLALVPALVWLSPYAILASDMAHGATSACDLASTWNFYRAAERMDAQMARSDSESRIVASDPDFPIVQVRTADRDYWIPRQGASLAGRELIAYLLAEHRWMEETNPGQQVKPGDVVLDCGAHVGIFTAAALRRGAARVVAFEIDPLNLRCLRLNFAREIAEGRVEVVPKGVWSSETTMDFAVSTTNSGMGSLVIQGQGSVQIPVPLTRIDAALAALGISRVDFIKMDIEGAEREALAGAAATLRRYKPTLALDAYHLPDDAVALPRVIAAANPAYTAVCGPCERSGHSYRPHVLYFR